MDINDLARDADGHLSDFKQWTEEIAAKLATEESITSLTDGHWKVIKFMRNEYIEKGALPTIRKITKESGVNTQELYALFPKGPAKKAAKIAGLPKPTGCI